MDLSLQLRMMSCLGPDSYIVVDQPSECSHMVDNIIQHMYFNSLLCPESSSGLPRNQMPQLLFA
jgi:hypothetical protein